MYQLQPNRSTECYNYDREIRRHASAIDLHTRIHLTRKSAQVNYPRIFIIRIVAACKLSACMPSTTECYNYDREIRRHASAIDLHTRIHLTRKSAQVNYPRIFIIRIVAACKLSAYMPSTTVYRSNLCRAKTFVIWSN
jgi:hypothetical protein